MKSKIELTVSSIDNSSQLFFAILTMDLNLLFDNVYFKLFCKDISKDVKVTKEYDGTRISAVKIITGDVEIDENAKVQMETRSANSLVSAVNEILTPPEQAIYKSNGDKGNIIDFIIEKYKDGTEYTYELDIKNKGTDNEEVVSLKRRKVEIKDSNGNIIKIIPEYTISLEGF